jgi:hypothetical protein
LKVIKYLGSLAKPLQDFYQMAEKKTFGIFKYLLLISVVISVYFWIKFLYQCLLVCLSIGRWVFEKVCLCICVYAYASIDIYVRKHLSIKCSHNIICIMMLT